MQIDFHHGVTYTVTRLAGFAHRDAETVAYCAQYVDDAINSCTVRFDNCAMYSRISSVHKLLDYRNFHKPANCFVWIPFHFLPGNGGIGPGENPDGNFVEKIACRQNSYVVRDILGLFVEDRNTPFMDSVSLASPCMCVLIPGHTRDFPALFTMC